MWVGVGVMGGWLTAAGGAMKASAELNVDVARRATTVATAELVIDETIVYIIQRMSSKREQ